MTRGRKKLDLIGQTFGYWLVLREVPKAPGSKIRRYMCLCQCGIQKIVFQNSLTSGKSKSCGCDHSGGKKPLTLEGKKFGKLTVLCRSGSLRGMSNWLCKCECGNLKEVSATCLKYGYTKSCGCLRAELNEKKKKEREDRIKEKMAKKPHVNPPSNGDKMQTIMCAEKTRYQSKKQREIEEGGRVSIIQKLRNKGIGAPLNRYR